MTRCVSSILSCSLAHLELTSFPYARSLSSRERPPRSRSSPSPRTRPFPPPSPPRTSTSSPASCRTTTQSCARTPRARLARGSSRARRSSGRWRKAASRRGTCSRPRHEPSLVRHSLSLFLRLSRGVQRLTRCYRARPVRPRQPDLAPLRDRAVQHLHRLCRPRLAPPLVLVTVVGRGTRGAAQAQRSVQEPGRGSARDGRERARVALGSVVGAAAGRRAGRGSRAAGRGGAAVEGQRVDSRGENRAASRTFSSSSLIAGALRGRYILTLHMHIHARERYREALLLVTSSCASSPSS